MAKPKDIKGMKFGRLTALERAHKVNGTYKWRCRCDCGKIHYATVTALTSGNVKSCGCLKIENPPPIHTKHGLLEHGKKREKLYNIWVAIKQRCCNPNDVNYMRYGGRGIKVCDEWLNDYIAFKEWCINNGYKEGLDLDRENNDGNYEPNNCRFITHRENLKNTHRKLHDVINGEDITLSDAAEKYGFTYNCLYNRYKRGKRGDDLIA